MPPARDSCYGRATQFTILGSESRGHFATHRAIAAAAALSAVAVCVCCRTRCLDGAVLRPWDLDSPFVTWSRRNTRLVSAVLHRFRLREESEAHRTCLTASDHNLSLSTIERLRRSGAVVGGGSNGARRTHSLHNGPWAPLSALVEIYGDSAVLGTSAAAAAAGKRPRSVRTRVHPCQPSRRVGRCAVFDEEVFGSLKVGVNQREYEKGGKQIGKRKRTRNVATVGWKVSPPVGTLQPMESDSSEQAAWPSFMARRVWWRGYVGDTVTQRKTGETCRLTYTEGDKRDEAETRIVSTVWQQGIRTKRLTFSFFDTLYIDRLG
ncbi:hypothetical protein MRX96_003794 [Rhipicephalus microplus]